MKFKGICVQAALLSLASTVVASFSLAQQHPPFDPHAVPITRGSQVQPRTGTKNAGPTSNGASLNSTISSGTPYQVGPTITPTSSIPEADSDIAVDPTSLFNVVAVTSDYSRGGFNNTKYAVSFNNGGAGSWSEGFMPLVTSDSISWQA